MNTWLKYTDRSYQQIKDSVLTRVQALVPEITDHTESNLFVKLASIWAALIEMLGYYVDNQARETHLLTARLYRSGIQEAHNSDYRVKARRPATANLLFTISAVAGVPVNIPTGTIVETASGKQFHTINGGTIPIGQTSVIIAAEQIDSIVTGSILGVSAGTNNQSFEITDLDYTDQSVSITVAGLGWLNKQTLGYENGTQKAFVQTINQQGKPIVQFGDNFNGAVPAIGQNIVASYRRCAGADGNVEANSITQLVSAVTLPSGLTLTITNPDRASGGAEIESLEDIRYRLPRAVRTLLRAVNEQDYIDLAEIANGVARAGVIFNCGKEIEIYIVPEGGGVASGALLTSTYNWLDDKRMITTKVVVYPAGEVHLQLVIDLRVRSSYQNVSTAALVRSNLADFISYKYQKIGGSVQLSDIYEVIENTVGVEYSKVVTMVAVPCARPILGTPVPLVWTRQTMPASGALNRWTIGMISATTFQLFKNNLFVGTFAVGTLVTQPEVEFTITAGGYVMGHQWEFLTYPYFGTLVLSEPSLLVSLPTDIVINATGGL